jgi:trans-aconitate methyltransferase
MPPSLPAALVALLDRVRHLGYLAGMPPVGRLRLDTGWWDRSYESGQNERYVADDQEWERLAISAALALHGRPCATVLDVGCGTGRFLDFVRAYDVRRYMGVDFSQVALEAARRRAAAHAPTPDDSAGCARSAPAIDVAWIQADLQTWQPSEPVDVIVLSEVAYYLARQADVLERLVGALRPGGVAVVSMWEDRRRGSQWRAVTRALRQAGAAPQATVKVRVGALSWKIRRYVMSA